MFVSSRSTWLRAAAFLAVLAPALPSGVAHAAPKKPVSDSDEAQKMFDHASKNFKKGYYDEAVTEFEKLRNTYPFSKFAVEAELKIADALFKKREYGDAADAYRTFAKLHPKHEQVDYAAFRVGLSLFLEAPKAVDRDQASTEKSLDEFRAFIQQYPDSKYADEAAKKIGDGRDRLAAKELYVGRYYTTHKKWHAALGRLKNVVDRYPDSPSEVEAQYLLGMAQWRLHDNDTARATLTDFVAKHPDTKWSRDARKILAKLGVSVARPTPTPKEEEESATPSPSSTPTAATPTPTPSPSATPAPAASPATTP
ncbi:MAG TPA: outer membrane protein assembly factor BamD [bacterium]|nr:outer membrane protein assembly factor BamD [bacterium]